MSGVRRLCLDEAACMSGGSCLYVWGRPSVCLGEAVCMSGVRPSVWGRPSVCLGEAICMSG